MRFIVSEGRVPTLHEAMASALRGYLRCFSASAEVHGDQVVVEACDTEALNHVVATSKAFADGFARGFTASKGG